MNVFDAEEIEHVICAANTKRGESTTHRENGELMMKCPFHPDDTASLSANPGKMVAGIATGASAGEMCMNSG